MAAVDELKSGHATRSISDPLLTAVEQQDSLLRSASLSARDPFKAWTPAGPAGSPKTVAVASALTPVIPPRAVLLMQDGSSMIVQIEVDGEPSPKLPIGGSFRGWTITGVTPSKVTLVKDGKSYSVDRP